MGLRKDLGLVCVQLCNLGCSGVTGEALTPMCITHGACSGSDRHAKSHAVWPICFRIMLLCLPITCNQVLLIFASSHLVVKTGVILRVHTCALPVLHCSAHLQLRPGRGQPRGEIRGPVVPCLQYEYICSPLVRAFLLLQQRKGHISPLVPPYAGRCLTCR